MNTAETRAQQNKSENVFCHCIECFAIRVLFQIKLDFPFETPNTTQPFTVCSIVLCLSSLAQPFYNIDTFLAYTRAERNRQPKRTEFH